MKETDELTKIIVDSMVKAAMGVKKQDENFDSLCKQTAKINMKLFDAHLEAGFKEDAAFQILLTLIAKAGK